MTASSLLKLSGKALLGSALQNICQAVAKATAAGYPIVIVHGGGAQLDELASRHGIKSITVAGRRITDSATLDLAKMAFSANGVDLVAALRAAGVVAIPVPAGAGGIVTAKRRPPQTVRCDDGSEHTIDYGYVGDIVAVNRDLLQTLLHQKIVPVISPLAMDDHGQCFNINADTLAAHLAASIGATELMMVSDVTGLYADPKNPQTCIAQLNKNQLQTFITSGAASGGMLPKLAAVDKALTLGVERVRICSFSAISQALAGLDNKNATTLGTVISS